MSDQVEVASLAYGERRLVHVGPNDAVYKARRNLPEAPAGSGKVFVKAILSGLGGPLVAIPQAISAIRASQAARQEGLGLLLISHEEASALRFPIGHWQRGVVYAAHPVDPSTYFTVASFHRQLFEHKVSEALSIASSLGAVQIDVEHVRGWREGISVSANLTVPGAEVEIGPHVQRDTGKNDRIMYQMRFDRRQAQPKVPEGTAWLAHEPLWQAFVDARLNQGLNQFAMEVSYVDDLGLDASVSAAIAKVGLKVGGTFTQHTETVWRLSCVFESGSRQSLEPSS
jgi:hypothetical protein